MVIKQMMAPQNGIINWTAFISQTQIDKKAGPEY
jgi:hypothetical protein